MKVLKFGGTSIENGDRIRNVLDIIRLAQQNSPVIVVVSAIRKVTDLLHEAAQVAAKGDTKYREQLGEIEGIHSKLVQELVDEPNKAGVKEFLHVTLKELGNVLHGVSLLRELTDRSNALILSFGERFSAWIISSFLRQEGMDASYADAREIIVTDTNHCYARVDMEASADRIEEWYKAVAGVPVVTGYIGAAPDGAVTTLGRGGSDYTATIIGSVTGADEIQIWTDVDGFYSADPKRVKDAYVLPFISYDEAVELSHSGAKVLHPYSVHPAMKAGIPITIRNTRNPDAKGTCIAEYDTTHDAGAERPVTGLSSTNDVVLFNLTGSGMVGESGIASRLFSCLARHQINSTFISQTASEQSISLVINKVQAEKALRILTREFSLEIAARQIESLTQRKHIAVIAVVGNNMSGHPGVSAHLFETLGKNGINVIAVAQGANETNISFVVDSSDEEKALNCVHESFLLSRRRMHVFIAGTGTIAKSLIGQIRDHMQTLRKEQELDVVVSGLANTRMMALHDNGVDLKSWEKYLKPRKDDKTIQSYIESIRSRNLHNTIFVDCTASAEVAASYPELLASNISVVTANKLGTAGSWELYETISKVLRTSNARFLYETNVGAGLPIINTLADLRNSGDRIIKIEGVLSGTLSYIFNELRKGGAFSEIVGKARDAGYTEPDPREDLSGADFARKFLILGRELGFRLDYEDITCESLVPASLSGEMSIDLFMEKLKCVDAEYEEKRQEAAQKNMTIAYTGEISDGKARIGVNMIPVSNPVAGLNGTENMVVFTTDRYYDTPLVVKGPGAGGEVTAGGVFADILRIASYLV